MVATGARRDVSAREHLLVRLSDGESHECSILASEIGVSRKAIQQAVSRLRRAGVAIKTEGQAYSLGRGRCAVCGTILRQGNHACVCSVHTA